MNCDISQNFEVLFPQSYDFLSQTFYFNGQKNLKPSFIIIYILKCQKRASIDPDKFWNFDFKFWDENQKSETRIPA